MKYSAGQDTGSSEETRNFSSRHPSPIFSFSSSHPLDWTRRPLTATPEEDDDAGDPFTETTLRVSPLSEYFSLTVTGPGVSAWDVVLFENRFSRIP